MFFFLRSASVLLLQQVKSKSCPLASYDMAVCPVGIHASPYASGGALRIVSSSAGHTRQLRTCVRGDICWTALWQSMCSVGTHASPPLKQPALL